MDYRLEVIGIPVSDVDASKSFYSDVVGFAVDHDISPGPGMRVVQLTPRGSPCSIVIGEGMPLGEPGTTKGAQLVVDDLDVAPGELTRYGRRGQTRTEHLRQIRRPLGFRKATASDLARLETWLVDRALEHDRPT